ncbi:MAG: DUF87 domain-containing protein [Desulfurococcales archaeon]|nr:DUF87 domain-containing protein [Desulfurococcales archaeon]
MTVGGPLIRGYTTRILEYTRIEGVILRPAEAIVKYGTLLRIDDRSQDRVFLGMIVDVKEETTHPALDVERFKDLYLRISEARYEEANRVLEELFSPQQDLIKWSSIMTVDIKILGEIGDGRLKSYDRPPRPMSTIAEPDPEWLERVIHASLGEDYHEKGIYIGRLSVNPDIRIYLNPSKFDTHLSILAQTGAGKTETVKRLVAETAWRKDVIGKSKGGIIVFDIAGEYTGYPYYREDTVPLIDAVYKGIEYFGSKATWASRARYTVIVPYDTPGWRLTDKLVEDLDLLAGDLEKRLGGEWRSLLISRDDILEYTGSGLSHIGFDDVRKMLKAADRLVIGVPYPSFYTLDELTEVAATRSEYFEVVVGEVASSLDIMEGDEVLNVPAVYAIVKLAYTVSRLAKPEEAYKSIGGVVNRLIEYLRIYAEKRDLTGELKRDKREPRSYFKYMTIYDIKALAGVFLLLAKDGKIRLDVTPRDDHEALLHMLHNPTTEREVRDRLRDALSSVVSFYDSRTLASVQRGLKKAVMRSSSILTPTLFDMIVERASEGFTIIHLAPPSTGDVDMLLGLIIRRVFHYHVGRYQRDRLTLLVVEEAHNLAPPVVDKASKRSLLRVAREGRKWGLSMWLVSQRPSFIDASILSQTATSILLRTTNPEDLSMIKRSIESVAGDIVDRLPELEPTRGEALIAGLAAPERRIPLLVNVEMLRPKTT